MKLRHICEVCGKEEILTPDEAYQEGWDYPPNMGTFGVLSQRTCPNCPINKTLWWRVAVDRVEVKDLTDREFETLERVTNEPASIQVTEV